MSPQAALPDRREADDNSRRQACGISAECAVWGCPNPPPQLNPRHRQHGEHKKGKLDQEHHPRQDKHQPDQSEGAVGNIAPSTRCPRQKTTAKSEDEVAFKWPSSGLQVAFKWPSTPNKHPRTRLRFVPSGIQCKMDWLHTACHATSRWCQPGGWVLRTASGPQRCF